MKDLTWLKETQIAHRGLHTEDLSVPENSMLSLKKAMDLGYGLEFDLNLLKDGNLIVFHDFNLKRLTGLNKTVEDLTLEDIKDLKLYDTSEHIPLLSEVLEMVDGKVPLLIELKPFGHVDLFCKNFMTLMKDYKGLWAVFSFHPGVVHWFKKHQPQVIRGQISEFFNNDEGMSKILKFFMKRLWFNAINKPDFISYGVYDMPNKYLDKAKKKGITVISYAARNQEQFDFVKDHYDNIVFEYFIPKK